MVDESRAQNGLAKTALNDGEHICYIICLMNLKADLVTCQILALFWNFEIHFHLGLLFFGAWRWLA